MERLYSTKILSIVVILMFMGLGGCNSNDSPSSPGTAVKVYAILAGDDADSSIGESDMVDVNHIKQWLSDIAQNTGFPVETYELKASTATLTRASLASAIATINAKITNNDVVIFWYTGHGGANENPGGSKWPVMAFQDLSGRFNYDEVDFNAAVIAPLQSLGAKLVIAAADCCNNYSWQTKLAPFVQASAPENYKTLFTTQGSLVMSGAAPGEFSIATSGGGPSVDGGAFTNQFLRAFYGNVAADSPSWQTIATNTRPVIRTGSDVQHPQVDLSLN